MTSRGGAGCVGTRNDEGRQRWNTQRRGDKQIPSRATSGLQIPNEEKGGGKSSQIGAK